jgi:hypothetical protein
MSAMSGSAGSGRRLLLDGLCFPPQAGNFHHLSGLADLLAAAPFFPEIAGQQIASIQM